MEANPLVSVIILSFNRKEELKNTISTIFAQSYSQVEVIVVDNASTDGTQEMLLNEHWNVKLIRLQRNIGINGWEVGWAKAAGEYVIILDDDCSLDNNAVAKIVETFAMSETVGAVALNVYNIIENRQTRFPGGWLPSENIEKPIEWFTVLGCSFAARRTLLTTNIFPKDYFIAFHEPLVSHYIKARNYTIVYANHIRSFHHIISISHVTAQRRYHHYKNMLNFVFWYAPLPSNFYYSAMMILLFLYCSVCQGWTLLCIKATIKMFKKNGVQNLRRISRLEFELWIKAGLIEYKPLRMLTRK